MQMHHLSIPSDVLLSSLYLFYCCFPFRGFAFKCQSNAWTAAAANSDSERSRQRLQRTRMSFFHRKTTVFGVFYSELIDRAASHAACMAFESFWSTQPFTLLARLPTQASCHLTRRLYGFCKLLFVKIPARVNPQIRTVRTGKFLSFS